MVFPYCTQIHIPAFHIVLLMARHMDKKKLRSIFFYDIHNYTCIIIAWAVHDKVSVQGQYTILSHEDWIIDEAQWQNAHMTFIFHGQLCFMGKLLQWKKRHPRLLAWMKHLSQICFLPFVLGINIYAVVDYFQGPNLITTNVQCTILP